MNEQIKYQRNLMELALSLLETIELCTLPSLITKYQSEYAETMAELAGELAKLSKVKVIIHDEISY